MILVSTYYADNSEDNSEMKGIERRHRDKKSGDSQQLSPNVRDPSIAGSSTYRII